MATCTGPRAASRRRKRAASHSSPGRISSRVLIGNVSLSCRAIISETFVQLTSSKGPRCLSRMRNSAPQVACVFLSPSRSFIFGPPFPSGPDCHMRATPAHQRPQQQRQPATTMHPPHIPHAHNAPAPKRVKYCAWPAEQFARPLCDSSYMRTRAQYTPHHTTPAVSRPQSKFIYELAAYTYRELMIL